MGGLLDSRWAFRLRKPKHRRCRDNLERRTVSHPCFSLTNHSLLCPYCVCQCKHSNWFICLFIFCKFMKKLRRKQIFTPVGEKLKWWKRDISIGVSFSIRMASLPFGGVGGGRFRGLSEVHVCIDWSTHLDSTSCRRFVIDLASLRRCDGEGSP